MVISVLFGGYLRIERVMIPVHRTSLPPISGGNHPSFFPRGWFGLLAAALLVPAAAAAPIAAFGLTDLNPGSTRVGRSLSPRDYGQWISAYYFGNEA